MLERRRYVESPMYDSHVVRCYSHLGGVFGTLELPPDRAPVLFWRPLLH